MNQRPPDPRYSVATDRSQWRPYRFLIILAAMALVNWWVSASRGQSIAPSTAADIPIDAPRPVPRRPAAPVWQTSYQQALELADSQRLPVMIYFFGNDSWCQWCRKLENEVLTTEAFAAWAEGRVVLLKIRYPDAPQATDQRTIATMRIIRQFRGWITGYPTVLFISPQEDVLGKIGYVPGGVNAWIQEAQPFVGQRDKVARTE